MKNKIALFMLLAFAVCQAGFAASAPVEKLKRGGEGIFTAPLEWCNEYYIARVDHNVYESTASGIFVGTFMGAKRIINGTYDVLTFPINWPKEYALLFGDTYETALKEHRALKASGVK